MSKTLTLLNKYQDDFKDILIHSEKSLQKIWDNKEDEIWNEV